MSEKYAFIEAEYATMAGDTACAPSMTQMCSWLQVSRSGYYEWKNRPDSSAAKRRNELKLLIAKAFEDSDGTYGYRRIALQLARWGVRPGAELVRALMRELGVVACQPRPWRPSTTKQGQAGPIPHLIACDFSAAAPGEKMVGDITYSPTWEGWLYLATVIDCATRKVVEGTQITLISTVAGLPELEPASAHDGGSVLTGKPDLKPSAWAVTAALRAQLKTSANHGAWAQADARGDVGPRLLGPGS